MLPYIDLCRNCTTITVKNIFEIGAYFAQDADFLMEVFNLAPKDVFVFEAHPDLYEAITKIHSFNAYHNAVFNEEKEITFHIFPLDYKNTGWSSVYKHKSGDTRPVKVHAIRMDNFMERNKIDSIDFLKIDVEGATYAVLDGFGSRLKDVACIQLEAEHLAAFSLEGQDKLYGDISSLLLQNDFDLVELHRFNGMKQSDSFWVQRKYIKYTELLPKLD